MFCFTKKILVTYKYYGKIICRDNNNETEIDIGDREDQQLLQSLEIFEFTHPLPTKKNGTLRVFFIIIVTDWRLIIQLESI